MDLSKICRICGLDKILKEFGPSKRHSGGLQSGCRKCNNLRSVAHRNANKEKVTLSKDKWRRAHGEKIKEIQTRWRKNNLDKGRAYAKRYIEAKRLSTPVWLTDDQIEHMKNYYDLARALTDATKIKHSVDHIIPMGGNIACGLNVPWNLQVMDLKANISKGNNRLFKTIFI